MLKHARLVQHFRTVSVFLCEHLLSVLRVSSAAGGEMGLQGVGDFLQSSNFGRGVSADVSAKRGKRPGSAPLGYGPNLEKVP
jgi:hypothetical protein